MTNLFSSFDPKSKVLNLSLNWLSAILGLGFLPCLFWAMHTRWSLLWANITMTLHKVLKFLLGQADSGAYILFVSLFGFIVLHHCLGLLPYVFTSSSHQAMTSALDLPLWLIFTHTQHMLVHLVSSGTSGPLMPIMVMIKTVSNIIRPGTLAVPLAMNMIAFHLLLTRLGNTGNSLSLTLLSILIFSQILLLILEAAFAVIQSVVFAVLSTLYASEVKLMATQWSSFLPLSSY